MHPITLFTMMMFCLVLAYEILCQLNRAQRSVMVAFTGGFTVAASVAIALSWSGGSDVFLECMKLGVFQFLLAGVSATHLAQIYQDKNKDSSGS